MKKEMSIPRPLEQQVLVGRGFYDLRLSQKKTMLIGEYCKMVDEAGKVARGKTTEAVEKVVSSPVLGSTDKTDSIIWCRC